MSLARVELNQFVPAAEFHLPPAGEGHMLLGIGHLAFALTQAPEAPHGVRLGEIPSPWADEVELGVRGLTAVRAYSTLPRVAEPVDLVRGQTVEYGRLNGIAVKSPNGVAVPKQTGKIMDTALATVMQRDALIAPNHAQLFVANTGVVSVRSLHPHYTTVATLEEGTPSFIKPFEMPKLR